MSDGEVIALWHWEPQGTYTCWECRTQATWTYDMPKRPHPRCDCLMTLRWVEGYLYYDDILIEEMGAFVRDVAYHFYGRGPTNETDKPRDMAVDFKFEIRNKTDVKVEELAAKAGISGSKDETLTVHESVSVTVPRKSRVHLLEFSIECLVRCVSGRKNHVFEWDGETQRVSGPRELGAEMFTEDSEPQDLSWMFEDI